MVGGAQMHETNLISARVSTTLAKRLATLAQYTQRSKSYIVAQAIEEFVNVNEWQIDAIKEGIAAAERDEVVPHAQALAVLGSWGPDVNT